MKIDGFSYRTIWVDEDGWSVRIIDQTKLPWAVEIVRLTTLEQGAHAIRSMQVRGAPLIGATAAYALCLAIRADASTDTMEQAAALLAKSKSPTRDQIVQYMNGNICRCGTYPRIVRAIERAAREV